MLKTLLEASLSKSRKLRSLMEATAAAVSFHPQRVLTSPLVPASGKCLCIFAHFDPLERVDAHVFHHLGALRDLGADIVFVSTSNRLNEQDCQQLLTLCHKVILRKNFGYDFGSYRAGLMEMADARDYEQFVLVNDSIYGPLHDLKAIFEAMAQRPADIWAITDSYESEYHLQSYFLVFNRKAWRHRLFKRFWKKFLHVQNKRSAIHLYEIGLSRQAKKADLQLDAWCDSARIAETVLKKASVQLAADLKESSSLDEIEKRRLIQLMDVSLGSPCNITHFYWDYLIRDFKCPYLKVELLRDNPMRIPNVAFYRELLNGTYPADLISNHLRKNGRGRH